MSLQVEASNSNNTALTFSAEGLPEGLTINPSTGVISGTVARGQVAVFIITVTASDGVYADSRTFAWTIASPVSLTNPDQYLTEGDEVSLRRKKEAEKGSDLDEIYP